MTSLPETTIAEVATDSVYFERSEPWASSASVTLGEAFSGQDRTNSFGLKQTTASVRNFRLSNVHLDTSAMTLIKDGKRIRETFYLVPPEWYTNACVNEDGRIVLDSAADHVMARAFGNYYHSLVQTIPAIDWSLRDRNTSNVVLLSGHLTKWEEELLALLGHDRVPRIALDPTHHYWIPNLEYCEFQNGSTVFELSRSAHSTFGRLVDAAVNADPATADIIYVARSDTLNRVAENEQEVMALLRSEGVRVVIPGNLSVADQINLFHKAGAIIGPHGAGLANVAFCKPGTIFYELLPSHYLNPCFNMLAQAAGLDYVADVFKSHYHTDDTPHTGRWTLDPELILGRVREIKTRLVAGRSRPALQISGPIAGLLDASWYVARYPDVAASGFDPLYHYVYFGVNEARDPNGFFDNAWYKAQYPDVADSGMNPLLHYLQVGAAETRSPHPHFDVAFYVDQHPEAAANPLLYHLQIGAARGWPTEKPHDDTSYSPPVLTPMEAVVSPEQMTSSEWGHLGQWQLDEIALGVSPISFFSAVDISSPPDECAHRFAGELAAALSAAGSRVRQHEIAQDAAIATGIELTLDAVPGPAQQAVATALWNAGIRYRLHFQTALARPLINIGLRPDCPLPRIRAEIAPGWASHAVTPAAAPPSAPDKPSGPTPPPLDELMNLFRSIGDNCELGLVQRHAGAEPIDLLRFAGLHIPIEHRLRAIIDAIAKEFVGLGEPGTLHFETFEPDDNGKQEFVAQESVYHLRYHTARYVGEIDADRLLQQQIQVLQIWRKKFLDDLRAADKVCVWKSNLPQRESDIRDLLAVLRIYGRNTLLWVAQCDADHAAGTVADLGRGLFKGYVARFAPYDRAFDISLNSWFAMCARAYQVIPTMHGMGPRPADPEIPAPREADQPPADQPAPDAGAYDGWVDGLIDDRVCGWCWRTGYPDPISLELSVDGQTVATFIARDQRDDLKQIGIGNGMHGFYSPIALHGVRPEAVIRIKVLGTEIEIPGSGQRLADYQRL